MSAKPPFTLSRCTPEDLTELVQVEYQCFPQFVREAFMGCFSEADLPRLAKYYVDDMNKDPHVVWIKLVDNASGKIVAGSQWKIFLSKAPESSGDEPPPWLEGEMREKSVRMMNEFNENRRKANPGGFVHLHICFTHPDYRRRGAGGMMMKWGCDVADALFLPGWIEASPEGNFLYKTFGFYVYEHVAGGELGEGGTNMKREPRAVSFQGGKLDFSNGALG